MQMLVHIFNILIDETDFSRLQQRIVKRFVFLFPSESFRSHKPLHRIDRELQIEEEAAAQLEWV